MRASRAYAVALCAVVSTLGWPARTQVFRSRVDAVRIDVSVIRDTEPIAGLTARDFVLTDNGVEQDIDSTQLEHVPLRVYVAFDISGSVAGGRLRALQTAGDRLLDQLRPGDRVGVLTFADRLLVRAPMSEDLTAARASLSRVVPTGKTALRDAVALGVTLAGGDAGRGLLVVFTDGEDTASWLSTNGALEVARRADVVVHVVRAGARALSPGSMSEFISADADELHPTRFIDGLVDLTGGRTWTASSEEDLARLATAAFAEMRARYLLSYQPKGPARPGWHELRVRLRSGKGTVKARAGYDAGR